ncbi:MAG: hypothetical protein FADNKDHG_01474 [Holosporales bacterium]
MSLNSKQNDSYTHLNVDCPIAEDRKLIIQNYADTIHDALNGIGNNVDMVDSCMFNLQSQCEYNYLSNCYGKRNITIFYFIVLGNFSLKTTLLNYWSKGDNFTTYNGANILVN